MKAALGASTISNIAQQPARQRYIAAHVEVFAFSVWVRWLLRVMLGQSHLLMRKRLLLLRPHARAFAAIAVYLPLLDATERVYGVVVEVAKVAI